MTDEEMKKLKEDFESIKGPGSMGNLNQLPQSFYPNTCPNCGRCPCCGRPYHYNYPYMPVYPPHQQIYC